MLERLARDASHSPDADNQVVAFARGTEAGDKNAVSHFWDAHYANLVAFLRKLSAGHRHSLIDEEELAGIVLTDLLEQICLGAHKDLNSDAEFWSAICRAARWKLMSQFRCDGQLKRGGRRRVCDKSVHTRLLSAQSAPDATVEYRDELHRLLTLLLPDSRAIEIAGWRLGGFSAQQIATAYGLSKRKVERIWEEIRLTWRRAVENDGTHYRSPVRPARTRRDPRRGNHFTPPPPPHETGQSAGSLE
jgi:DNA-directed RNA polymerase specialized sigma24 family protein